MTEKYSCTIDAPFGTMYAFAENGALIALSFTDEQFSGFAENPDYPVFSALRLWAADYFSGREPKTVPPLRPHGTPFQLEIWDMLLKIPYGKVVTYGELAVNCAKNRGVAKMSAQAVGGAVGRNPIAVIIPCHRVIGAGRNLTGYGGGLHLKLKLLELEGVVTSDMYFPVQ